MGRLLSGILQQTVSDIEVIIVDSGSTDATVSIASRYPTTILSIAPEKFSFGRALNLGCRAAKGELAVMASAHAYPARKDWLERLLAPFADDTVALVYGKQRGNAKNRYAEHRVFARWFPEVSNPDQDHPFCNNANAAIRTKLWREIPYDESLTGLEDIDWARRAMAAGYRIAYVADAEVTHVHQETPKQIHNRYRREAIALKRIFPDEGVSALDLARLVPANVTTDWYHAWRDGVFRKNWRDIALFRVMQFVGAYRGNMQAGPVRDRLKRTFYYPTGFHRQQGAPPDNGNVVDYSADLSGKKGRERTD